MNSTKSSRRIKSVLAVLLALVFSASALFGFTASAAEPEATRSEKIQLVVKINDMEKYANGRDPVFSGKLISGKLDGKDRLNQIGIKYTRVPGEVVGKKYAINGSIVSDKYEVQFIPGKLTINPSSVNR